MTALLAFLAGPIGRWLVVGAMVLAFGGACYVKGVTVEENKRDAADAIRDAAALKSQIEAVTAARAEEHRKVDAAKGVIDEIHKQIGAAAAAVPVTRAAGVRLRDQITVACTAARSPAQPASAVRSAPADATASVLADVQRRLAEAEDATIGFVDRSRIAGLGCERLYESLTPPNR